MHIDVNKIQLSTQNRQLSQLKDSPSEKLQLTNIKFGNDTAGFLSDEFQGLFHSCHCSSGLFVSSREGSEDVGLNALYFSDLLVLGGNVASACRVKGFDGLRKKENNIYNMYLRCHQLLMSKDFGAHETVL